MSLEALHITGVILAGGQSRRMFETAGRPGERLSNAASGERLSNAASGERLSNAAFGERLSNAAFGERLSNAAFGDKGLLDIAGRPMLGHVIARLRPQVGRLVLNANGDPARFAAFGLPVVADTVGGFAGPLAGVLAGMRWSAAHAPEATHIATVSSDAPFIPDDLVARLAAAAGPAARQEKDGEPAGPAGPVGPDAQHRIALAQSGGELQPVIGLWPVRLADDLEAALTTGVRKVLVWADRHGTIPVPFEPVLIGAERVDPFFNANTPDELSLARRLLGA